MKNRSAILTSVGIAVIILVVGVALGSYLSPTLGGNNSSASNLTTFTRSCTGYPIFCGITSATWSSGATTTVVVFQLANGSTTSYYTLTLSHNAQTYSADSTTTLVTVAFSNSNTTSYLTETLYHFSLNYSTTYSETQNNSTVVLYANLGGASTPRFELQDFSLLAYNSFIHASYLYGLVVFNSTTVQPTSIQLLVNGTWWRTSAVVNAQQCSARTEFADLWKSGAG